MISLGIDIGGTTVKAAALRDGAVLWTGQSGAYARPDNKKVSARSQKMLEGSARPAPSDDETDKKAHGKRKS